MFFTSKRIKAGEELFFDYGKEFNLDWKESFDLLMSKYFKEQKIRKKSNRKKKVKAKALEYCDQLFE